MAGVESKITQNPPPRPEKYAVASEIGLRLTASVASLAAAWMMFTSKQSVLLYGIQMEARYSDASAFKFFAFANLIACVLSVESLFVAIIFARKRSELNNYFYLFLHDLVVTTLVMAGCAAATAIGFVGRYGNSRAGWMPICDHFARLCDRLIISVALSYFSLVLYLVLTVISAHNSRKPLL